MPIKNLGSKVGNVWKRDYDLGFDYWYCRYPLPRGCSLAMQHGYVKAAKQADACQLASMRHAERKGRFVFLDRFAHLSWKSGTSLQCGNESRMDVRIARAVVASVNIAH
jgi:hypothetical protein